MNRSATRTEAEIAQIIAAAMEDRKPLQFHVDRYTKDPLLVQLGGSDWSTPESRLALAGPEWARTHETGWRVALGAVLNGRLDSLKEIAGVYGLLDEVSPLDYCEKEDTPRTHEYRLGFTTPILILLCTAIDNGRVDIFQWLLETFRPRLVCSEQAYVDEIAKIANYGSAYEFSNVRAKIAWMVENVSELDALYRRDFIPLFSLISEACDGKNHLLVDYLVERYAGCHAPGHVESFVAHMRSVMGDFNTCMVCYKDVCPAMGTNCGGSEDKYHQAWRTAEQFCARHRRRCYETSVDNAQRVCAHGLGTVSCNVLFVPSDLVGAFRAECAAEGVAIDAIEDDEQRACLLSLVTGHPQWCPSMLPLAFRALS